MPPLLVILDPPMNSFLSNGNQDNCEGHVAENNEEFQRYPAVSCKDRTRCQLLITTSKSSLIYQGKFGQHNLWAYPMPGDNFELNAYIKGTLTTWFYPSFSPPLGKSPLICSWNSHHQCNKTQNMCFVHPNWLFEPAVTHLVVVAIILVQRVATDGTQVLPALPHHHVIDLITTSQETVSGKLSSGQGSTGLEQV